MVTTGTAPLAGQFVEVRGHGIIPGAVTVGGHKPQVNGGHLGVKGLKPGLDAVHVFD
jgi:hypothetical protein